jgi:hypothetical protein
MHKGVLIGALPRGTDTKGRFGLFPNIGFRNFCKSQNKEKAGTFRYRLPEFLLEFDDFPVSDL